jgi:hypothetical protein
MGDTGAGSGNRTRAYRLGTGLVEKIKKDDRLFDLGHSSKIEFVEQAAKALGKTLNVSLA